MHMFMNFVFLVSLSLIGLMCRDLGKEPKTGRRKIVFPPQDFLPIKRSVFSDA